MREQLSWAAVTTINDRLKHAEKEHPEGPSFAALESELMEVYEAIAKDNYIHATYELYDVIAVAIRLIEQFENK